MTDCQSYSALSSIKCYQAGKSGARRVRQRERDGMRVGAFNTHTHTQLNLTERNKCHRALKSLYVCLCASPLSPLNKNVASHGWRAIYLVSASTSVHINMPKKKDRYSYKACANDPQTTMKKQRRRNST